MNRDEVLAWLAELRLCVDTRYGLGSRNSYKLIAACEAVLKAEPPEKMHRMPYTAEFQWGYSEGVKAVKALVIAALEAQHG